MNEELSKKIIEWLDGLKDLGTSEIPSFVQEAAKYGFYQNLATTIILFIMQLILGSICIYCFYKINTTVFEKYSDGKFMYGLVGTLTGVFAFLICLGHIENITCMIKCKFAPRLYVIERFME